MQQESKTTKINTRKPNYNQELRTKGTIYICKAAIILLKNPFISKKFFLQQVSEVTHFEEPIYTFEEPFFFFYFD
jgi:hypothetical protein